ncbi:hypothetical protein SEMRO_1320_G262390.1 [Seminavis robusta]|uniref:Uncharacterized protein n=1 Tax=Seminavis robusta TaxID=568900 RepID=A0A9N8HTV5_9STRA|nr:hypothetical protein SEMRO_1320_G262390.1 [Seminavis robusta]|eukprot:Sro1320_g262390.1 n/a (226) ;mRNA; r:16892-17569
MSSLCNDEIKIAFFSRRSGATEPVSNATISSIVKGIQHGIQRCHDRECDVDMFACLQGNRVIPNALPICLEEINATMETASNGDLKFKTLRGNHTLHVMFSGGGSQFYIRERPIRRIEHAANNRPPRQQPPRQQPPRQQPPPMQQQQQEPPRRRTPAPSAAGRERVRNRSLSDDDTDSDDSSLEQMAPPRRRQRRPQKPPSDNDSSSADEYQNFSQLTGRSKKLG